MGRACSLLVLACACTPRAQPEATRASCETAGHQFSQRLLNGINDLAVEETYEKQKAFLSTLEELKTKKDLCLVSELDHVIDVLVQNTMIDTALKDGLLTAMVKALSYCEFGPSGIRLLRKIEGVRLADDYGKQTPRFSAQEASARLFILATCPSK